MITLAIKESLKYPDGGSALIVSVRKAEDGIAYELGKMHIGISPRGSTFQTNVWTDLSVEEPVPIFELGPSTYSEADE